MGYQLTIDDIRQSLENDKQKNGIDPFESQRQSMEKEHPYLYKLAEKLSRHPNIAKGAELLSKPAGLFNEAVETARLPSVAAGLVTGVEKTGENILNAPGAAINSLGGNVPKFNIPDYLNPSASPNMPQDSLSRLANLGGQLIGEAGSAGGVYGLGSKALGLGAKTPLYVRALLGGGTGALTSDSDQLGGRGLGSVLGGVLPMTHGLSKSTIGKRASEISENIENKFHNLYGDLFKEANKLSSANVRIPHGLQELSHDVNSMMKEARRVNKGGRNVESLNRFTKEPTLENAHDAQSNLGKIIRNLKNASKKEDIGTEGIKAIRTAEDLQKRIRGGMQQWFAKAGNNHLASEYGNITKQYAKEAAPFKIPEIRKFQHGKGSASKITQALLNEPQFLESEIAKELPGFTTRKAIEPIMPAFKKVATYSAILEGLHRLGLPGTGIIERFMK